MEIKVSVVIPCYEYGGKGVRYLSDMFRTISQQTLKEVEVIVTDQSVDTEIEDFCNDNIFDLNIIYFRDDEHRGDVATNMNIGMDLAKGEVVKMMFMDDYFYTKDGCRYRARGRPIPSPRPWWQRSDPPEPRHRSAVQRGS